jgi:HK97 family phage portal protein
MVKARNSVPMVLNRSNARSLRTFRLDSGLARGTEGISQTEFFEQGGFYDVLIGEGSQSKFGAWKLAAVYRCVALISETLACMKLNLIEYKDGLRLADTKHKLSVLLQTEPNKYTTWFGFTSSLMVNTLNNGNGYARIFRDRFGSATKLFVLETGTCVLWKKDNHDGSVDVYYLVNGEVVLADDIIHIKTIGSNGYEGDSVLSLASKTIMAGLEQQNLSYSMNKNGLNLEGVLETDRLLSDKAYERMNQQMNSFKGSKNASGTMILEEGLTYKPRAIKPSDAEFIANREFTVIDICRFLGCPPHKVFSLERSTNNNIAHQDLEFYKSTIMPYAVQFEQELDKKLLTKPERTGLRNYLKHKFDASVLLRADPVGRAKLYDSMFSKGALKPDEIRADDDRVPLNTDASNTTYMQLSYVPIDELVRIQTEKLANPNKQKIDEQNIKKEEDDESE